MDRLYLTLLGGGAFGNHLGWIIGVLRRSLDLYADVDLDVFLVSYGALDRSIQRLVNEFS